MFSSYFLVLKPGDGSWGTWTPYKNCPNGSLASAFRLRIQDYQGNEILQFSLNATFYIVYNSSLNFMYQINSRFWNIRGR